MAASTGYRQRGGRPRNADTDRAILAATSDLLVVRGYARVSMEAVAARSGVGKPTVYRRWPTKAALVADAVVADLAYRAGPTAVGPLPDTGEIEDDLYQWFNGFVNVATDPRNAALIRALLAAVNDNPDDAEALFELVTGPHRQYVTERLHTAAAAGQVRSDTDLQVLVDMLFGSVVVQLLTGRADMARTRARILLDMALHGVCPSSSE
jgi:AcrR family transcriptional regulator